MRTESLLHLKTLYFSIIVISFVFVLISSQTVFGYNETSMNPEDFYGNPVYQMDYNGSTLAITNILNKTTFKEGETITVIPEVTNLGNQTVNVYYDPALFYMDVKDQNGKIVGWSGGGDILVSLGMTIKPNTSSPAYVLAGNAMQKGVFTLTAGKYTITSIANIGNFGKPYYPRFYLWSEPVQITVLPEKVPEFPFASVVLALSIVSTIFLYQFKSKIKI